MSRGQHNLPWNIKDSRLLISLLRHRGKAITGTGDGRTAVASTPEHYSNLRETEPLATVATGAGRDIDFPNAIPENTNPEKPVMRVIRTLKGLALKFRKVQKLPGQFSQSLTDEATNDERERQEEVKKQLAFVVRKAPDIARMGKAVLDRLTRLRFANLETTNGKTKVHRVQAEMFAVDFPNANTYHMKLHVQSLPESVGLTGIINNETLDECLPLTNMPLMGELKPWGAIIKGYPGGLSGLPTIVTCKDAWDNLPESAGPYTINFGLSEGGLWKRMDLTEAPHLLIAGVSGYGKSNFENYIICSLLRKALPHHMLRLALFDLKDGMEFQPYEHVPYLMENEKLNHVVYNLDEVIPAMHELDKEMHRRARFLKEKGCRSIREYNLSVHGDAKLPTLFAIFDEFAMPVLEFKDGFLTPMKSLSNMSRAVGMHLIFATQYPKATIIDTLISINFQMRVVFKVSGTASQSVLGSWRAEKLPCRGRAVLQHEGDDWEVQTPLIPNTIIEETVGFAITGEKTRQAMMVGADDIVDAALEKYDGFMEIERLYDYFRGRKIGGKSKLNALLKSMDNNIYVVNGIQYQVVKPTVGSRKLVLVQDPSNPPVNLAGNRIPDSDSQPEPDLNPTYDEPEPEQKVKTKPAPEPEPNWIICSFCGTRYDADDNAVCPECSASPEEAHPKANPGLITVNRKRRKK